MPDGSVAGAACQYVHDGKTINGTCFGAAKTDDNGDPVFVPGTTDVPWVELACLAKCDINTVDDPTGGGSCTNPNSTCQASGILGLDETFGICIPNTTFAEAAGCPGGTHPVTTDAGVECIAPSGIESGG